MSHFNNEVLEKIWKDRYQKNNETYEENIDRVAKFISHGDEKDYKAFRDVMNKGLFFPAGRTMSNSGIGKNLTLNNCFISDQIQDDTVDIFEKVTLGAITHKEGGGIGYDFSNIRPKGMPTSDDGIASGPVSFMDVFNVQTSTILQGGRRGANMGVLNIYHMDILDFIQAKSFESGTLDHFNLSVMVDDDFLDAVKEDKEIFLHHPVYNKHCQIEKNPDNWIYCKKVRAKELWDKILRCAYDNGEPGIFFYDNMNKDNPLSYIETIVASNPCAEYLGGTVHGRDPKTGKKLNPKDFGGACNLGSLFLPQFVKNPFMKNASLDLELLSKTVSVAVRMLDNIIDINNFPSPIYENYQKNFRTIGLGITGLADMLAMLGLRYNTEEARKFIDVLMGNISYQAYLASTRLAEEKGSFPLLDKDKYTNCGYLTKQLNKNNWASLVERINKYGIRNAKILSIAPVGTLSLTYGNNCSSGLEPIFSLEYDRKVKIGGQDKDAEHIVQMCDYAYDLWKKIPNPDISEDVFITALEMSVDDHIDMLATIAKHVDMSCSKTINVPSEYTFEKTKEIYMRCHSLGIKGCTIFRPNKLRQGVLITKEDKTNEPHKLKRGEIIKVNNDVIGKERHLTTGCGTLHVQAFFNPLTGDLVETYLAKGSKGGCLSHMVADSRLISLAARGGIPLKDILDQLRSSVECVSYVTRSKTLKDTSKGVSCPSAVAYAIKEMYDEMQEELYGIDPPPQKKLEINNSKPLCPDCGEELVFEGGCIVCKSCGWSKCE